MKKTSFSKISAVVFIFATLFLSNFSKCGVLEDILLESACAGNNERIEELFALGIKIEINTDQKEGKNPLRCAAYGNHYKTVELLLNKGADIKHKDRFGRTVLFDSV
ncbi:MAG: ankyrin repeat domain-containing protein, partial [Thermoanaerobaculaceae bacterium]|nr:ankyrin repeat domain-containing protein [Thermoanaerobaculaceae bacterium]